MNYKCLEISFAAININKQKNMKINKKGKIK